jgi:hypothetical protein
MPLVAGQLSSLAQPSAAAIMGSRGVPSPRQNFVMITTKPEIEFCVSAEANGLIELLAAEMQSSRVQGRVVT